MFIEYNKINNSVVLLLDNATEKITENYVVKKIKSDALENLCKNEDEIEKLINYLSKDNRLFPYVIYEDLNDYTKSWKSPTLDNVVLGLDETLLIRFIKDDKYLYDMFNADSLEYLSNTDWYVTRLMETGKPIPEEVSKLREYHRSVLSND